MARRVDCIGRVESDSRDELPMRFDNLTAIDGLAPAPDGVERLGVRISSRHAPPTAALERRLCRNHVPVVSKRPQKTQAMPAP